MHFILQNAKTKFIQYVGTLTDSLNFGDVLILTKVNRFYMHWLASFCKAFGQKCQSLPGHLRGPERLRPLPPLKVQNHNNNFKISEI